MPPGSTRPRALYAPFFRWAKRRGMTLRNPMVDFEMPTSTYRSKERTPPEVEELTLLLATAVEVTPEIAPLLVLGAVTGTRRGELVAIPRSAVAWKKNQITVDTAITSKGKVKSTKTRRGRTFHVDAETIAMLQRHCDHMDERARTAGVELAADPFLFSLVADCSKPMPPDYFTKRVGVLKGYLGIEDKRPEVVALEDEALRLRRSPPPTATPRQDGTARPTVGCPSARSANNLVAASAGRVWPSQPPNAESTPIASGHAASRFRRINPRSPQVHLVGAPRCRIQCQHGRPAARTWPASPHAPLLQVASVIGQTSSRTPWVASCMEATHSSTTLSTSFANTSLLHGLGKRKDAGNDGAGQCPTGRFPQVSAAVTEGDGSSRIRIVPEL